MSDVPTGWSSTHLVDVTTTITKGTTPTTHGFEYKDSGINFIKVEDIHNGKIIPQKITKFISPEAHAFFKRSQLQAHDLLFSIAGSIGTICVVEEKDLPANTNQALAIIRGYEKVFDVKFLLFCFQSTLSNFTKSKARGGAMNNISLGDIGEMKLPVPPLAEQRRIVAKIEEIFSDLDDAEKNLKEAQAKLKRYRQSILKTAFQNGTEVLTIDDVGTVISGGTPDTKVEENFGNEINWVTPADLSELKGKYIKNGRRSLSKKGLQKSSAKIFPKNTVIFSSRAPIGYVAISEQEATTNQGCKNIILNGKTTPDYTYWYLKSSKKLAEDHASGTTFLEISGSKFGKLPIPVPEVEVQNKIVLELENSWSYADVVEEEIRKKLSNLQQLRQSILKRALEGKLVPQDPSDKPAEKLLDRIRAEKTVQTTTQIKRGRKAKT